MSSYTIMRSGSENPELVLQHVNNNEVWSEPLYFSQQFFLIMNTGNQTKSQSLVAVKFMLLTTAGYKTTQAHTWSGKV